jgi:hypothetical protein
MTCSRGNRTPECACRTVYRPGRYPSRQTISGTEPVTYRSEHGVDKVVHRRLLDDSDLIHGMRAVVFAAALKKVADFRVGEGRNLSPGKVLVRGGMSGIERASSHLLQ